jgi:glucosamine-6-phosphate deaminase
MELIIQPDAESAARHAAEIIASQLRAKPGLVLGLATGCTMESVYADLVRLHREDGLDFSRCRAFNLDEYVGLAPDHPSSYHYYMRHQLFDKVNINLRNTHLPNGIADDLVAECRHYEKMIADSGGIDLQLLGIGLNGHLGFNEPPSPLRSRTRVEKLTVTTRTQNAPLFPSPDKVPHQAITVGVGTILEARRCLLLATGTEKATIVAKAIQGPLTAMITASALQLHSDCIVVLDEDAAGSLRNRDFHSRAIPGPARAAKPDKLRRAI